MALGPVDGTVGPAAISTGANIQGLDCTGQLEHPLHLRRRVEDGEGLTAPFDGSMELQHQAEAAGIAERHFAHVKPDPLVVCADLGEDDVARPAPRRRLGAVSTATPSERVRLLSTAASESCGDREAGSGLGDSPACRAASTMVVRTSPRSRLPGVDSAFEMGPADRTAALHAQTRWLRSEPHHVSKGRDRWKAATIRDRLGAVLRVGLRAPREHRSIWPKMLGWYL